MLVCHFFKPFLITCNKRRNSALQNFGSDQVIDGLVTKKSMFSSKADGYFHDVILIFSQGGKFFTARRRFTRREKLYSRRDLFQDRVIYFHAVFTPIQRNFTEIPIILLHFTVVGVN